MPLKRNSKLLYNKKQKKQISSRLMQISLKVDDYVYKNVAISAKTAEMFIKEVSGYTDKCYEDKRSLQVIEKLTRCMKGIIAEQEELQGVSNGSDDYKVVDVETILAQPNYKTDGNEIVEPPKSNFKVIDLDDDTNCSKHFKNNEIIDLSNDEGDKDKKAKNLNESLQRSLSNLTIRQDNDPLSIVPLNSEDCSQSILNEVDCIDLGGLGKVQNTDTIEYGQDFDILPTNIYKKYKNEIGVTNVAPNSIIQNCRLKDCITTNKKNDSLSICASNMKKNNNVLHKNITKPKVQKKRSQKRAHNNFNKANEPNSTKKNRQKKKLINENAPSNKTFQINYKAIENSFKSEIENKVNNGDQVAHYRRGDDNFYQLANAEIQYNNNFNLNQRLEKPTHSICNNNIENDLSWIENIRYVREVGLEEKIPAYFENGFWENYTLPNNWNDDDFLYN